ncbi:hypothetical protein EDC04DRAFT_2625265, partial [Pisolithus marmoratus]
MWKQPSTLTTLLLLFTDHIGQHFLVTHTTFPFSHCYTSSTLTFVTNEIVISIALVDIFACMHISQVVKASSHWTISAPLSVSIM